MLSLWNMCCPEKVKRVGRDCNVWWEETWSFIYAAYAVMTAVDIFFLTLQLRSTKRVFNRVHRSLFPFWDKGKYLHVILIHVSTSAVKLTESFIHDRVKKTQSAFTSKKVQVKQMYIQTSFNYESICGPQEKIPSLFSSNVIIMC